MFDRKSCAVIKINSTIYEYVPSILQFFTYKIFVNILNMVEYWLLFVNLCIMVNFEIIGFFNQSSDFVGGSKMLQFLGYAHLWAA